MADPRYTPHPRRRRPRQGRAAAAIAIHPPTHLTDNEAACFRELAEPLTAARRLAPEDATSLEAFAVTLARVREADEYVRRDGAYLEARNGILYVHPAAKIAAAGRRELRAWAARFGCTFKDRLILKHDGAPESDDDPLGIAELRLVQPDA